MRYLPKEMLYGSYPDREFFWKVVSTILPAWTEKYIATVVDQRRSLKPNPPKDKTIKISDKWLAKLSAYD